MYFIYHISMSGDSDSDGRLPEIESIPYRVKGDPYLERLVQALNQETPTASEEFEIVYHHLRRSQPSSYKDPMAMEVDEMVTGWDQPFLLVSWPEGMEMPLEQLSLPVFSLEDIEALGLTPEEFQELNNFLQLEPPTSETGHRLQNRIARGEQARCDLTNRQGGLLRRFINSLLRGLMS